MSIKSLFPGLPSSSLADNQKIDVTRRVGMMRSILMKSPPINTDQIFGVSRVIEDQKEGNYSVFP